MHDRQADRPNAGRTDFLRTREGHGGCSRAHVGAVRAVGHIARLLGGDAIGPMCRPHVMPGWGAWFDEGLDLSSGIASRKAPQTGRASGARVATTDNPLDKVIVEGDVTRATDATAIEAFTDGSTTKYEDGLLGSILRRQRAATGCQQRQGVRASPSGELSGYADPAGRSREEGDAPGAPQRWYCSVGGIERDAVGMVIVVVLAAWPRMTVSRTQP